MYQLRKSAEANANPQSPLKVWIFAAIPVVGFLLAAAGHLFIR
jgi:hypothetical protein